MYFYLIHCSRAKWPLVYCFISRSRPEYRVYAKQNKANGVQKKSSSELIIANCFHERALAKTRENLRKRQNERTCGCSLTVRRVLLISHSNRASVLMQPISLFSNSLSLFSVNYLITLGMAIALQMSEKKIIFQ